MKPIAIKIAYIGGGSRYWARDLLGELALTPGLTGSVDLYDIDYTAAQKNAAIAEAIFKRPEARSRFRVRAARKLRETLRGADFVVLSIEPGPTEARYADLVIPARYGIVQPVGDTTGPGGIARALRAVPLYAEFAKQIAEHCPKAWVINYTNPMTLCTAALYAVAPRIKAFGCCHEVFHTQKYLAGLVADSLGMEAPPRQEVAIKLTGINHFTWVTDAHWGKHDLLALLRQRISAPLFFRSRESDTLKRKAAGQWFKSCSLVSTDLLRRFDVLGAAGDRHLSEFVPWYATGEKNLHRWGVPLTPYRWRLARASQRDQGVEHYADNPIKTSDEEGVKLIEALAGLAPLTTNVNFPNRGQAADLPLGHIVETNASFSRNQILPVQAPVLPPGARSLVRRVIDVQQLTLRAGLERDPDLAFQALIQDPLVHLPVDRSWKMFKTILHHVRHHLPGWKLPPA